MTHILKIAHRGYSALYPENTLPAFIKAVECGADMVEFDVHLSRDGHPVVIHDNDVDRTSDGTGNVRDMTLAELKELDFNFKKLPELGRVPLPTLDEVLETLADRVMLNIEIKNCPYRYPGIEEAVIRAVRDRGIEDRVIVSSFDHYSLMRVKEIHEKIRTGMLYEGAWLYFQEEARTLRAYSVHPEIDVIDVNQIAWARQNGYKVFTWVATARKEIEPLIRSGSVDGIMVNDLSLFDCGEHDA